MKFYGDYHTHTLNSHGKGTILDNAKAAANIGLTEIAITDHSFSQMYGIKRKNVAEYLRQVKEAQEQTGVSVLFSVEANIVGKYGELDVKDSDLANMGLLIAGYHYVAMPHRKIRDSFGFFLPNYLSLIWGTSKRRKMKNTDAYIKAIENNKIDILTHLNYGVKTDVFEVAKVCAKYGTILELNGKRINFTYAEFEKMIELGAKFILTSDGHSPGKIGDFSLGLNFLHKKESFVNDLEKVDKSITLESVLQGSPFLRECLVNIDSRPTFRSVASS